MLYSAIIFGLLGSFHCVGMCGPIAFMLPLDRTNNYKRIQQVLSYHTGRLLTYAFLGFIVGLIGKSFNLFGLQQQLSIAIGALMILAILLPSIFFKRIGFSKFSYGLVAKVKNAIGIRLKQKSAKTFFTLGAVNGFLPCGLVYMAIFGALAMDGFYDGALYMVLFGLGTIPLMTTAIYLGNFLNNKTRILFKKVIPVVVIFFGVLFILRGLGLDIPYLSPSELVSIELISANKQCH